VNKLAADGLTDETKNRLICPYPHYPYPLAIFIRWRYLSVAPSVADIYPLPRFIRCQDLSGAKIYPVPRFIRCQDLSVANLLKFPINKNPHYV
jgi:hypothetical protein